MSLTDEIRINILDALLKKNSVVPNFRQIKRYTGYHLATVKGSLEFMQKQGFLAGFGPKINLRQLGYNLEVISMAQVDFSKKDIFEKLVAAHNSDPNVYRACSVIGPSNWNYITHHIYKDIDSYHQNIRKTYYEKIPELYDIVKDRQIYYETEPVYKNASRTESVLKIIKADLGHE